MAINQREAVNFTAKTTFSSCVNISGSVNFTGPVTFGGSSLYLKEIYYPWQLLNAAASTMGMAASMAGYKMSSSLTALTYSATCPTCPMMLTIPIPPDAATSGSGQLLIDWTDNATTAGIAAVRVAVFAVNNTVVGSGSTLAAQVATCITNGGTASQFNTASLVNFNAPAAGPNGNFVVRWEYLSGSSADNTTGSNFVLHGFRLRYAASILGPVTS